MLITLKNLKPTDFPSLTWESQKLREPLDKLCIYATCQAQEAINWYFCKKEFRRYLCRTLRIVVILLVAFAGILPIINEILGKDHSIHSLWSALALSVAATLILLDRFYGFTTGWIRFLLAGQQLSEAVETFRLEIEQQKLNWGRLEPTQEEALVMLRHVQVFLKQIRGTIHDETMQWATEFTEVLKQVDEQVKLVTHAERKSALQIIVTNGDLCADGWNLTVGDQSPEKHYGKDGAAEVPAGLHVVQLEAQINSKSVHAGMPVKVNPGEIQKLEFTLS